MSDVLVIARLALQEAVRRRVLTVVAILTLVSSVLYLIGCLSLKHHTGGLLDVEEIKPIVPATLLGLASFATLFLGSVLAVFLAAGAVRGDADRGLVQPLVVRPVGRNVYLAGRALAATVLAGGYVLVVSLAAIALTIRRVNQARRATPQRRPVPVRSRASASMPPAGRTHDSTHRPTVRPLPPPPLFS